MSVTHPRPSDWPKSVMLFAALLTPLASGCATGQLKALEPDPRSHYIMVHKEGYPLDRNENALSNDAFRNEYVEAILLGIDRHVKQRWESKQVPQVLFFVHGGLNPYQTGLDRIGKLVNTRDEGGKKKDLLGRSSYYPVFINWNSSFGSSWWDDSFIIRRGTRDPWGGSLTSPFVLAGRLAESAFTAPRAWWFQGENAVDSFSTTDIPGEKEEVRVFIGFSYFVLFPFRALTVPGIQGFGTPAWEMMKRRTDLLLASKLRPNDYAVQGAARTLMEALEKRIPRDKNGKPSWGRWKIADGAEGPIEMTLVGHSMGAMVLDRLLRAFPDAHFKHIVYMAAASSIEDFEYSVLPYLSKHTDSKFWGFSLSESDETREKVGFDIIERGSLLVWIDNLFERVLTPSQKRFGRYKNYCKYYQLPEQYLPRVRVIKFRGEDNQPRRHGEFDDEEKLEGMLRQIDPEAYPPISHPAPSDNAFEVNCAGR